MTTDVASIRQAAYEAEIQRQPLYTATKKRRPTWLQLSDKARESWEIKAGAEAAERA